MLSVVDCLVRASGCETLADSRLPVGKENDTPASDNSDMDMACWDNAVGNPKGTNGNMLVSVW